MVCKSNRACEVAIVHRPAAHAHYIDHIPGSHQPAGTRRVSEKEALDPSVSPLSTRPATYILHTFFRAHGGIPATIFT